MRKTLCACSEMSLSQLDGKHLRIVNRQGQKACMRIRGAAAAACTKVAGLMTVRGDILVQLIADLRGQHNPSLTPMPRERQGGLAGCHDSEGPKDTRTSGQGGTGLISTLQGIVEGYLKTLEDSTMTVEQLAAQALPCMSQGERGYAATLEMHSVAPAWGCYVALLGQNFFDAGIRKNVAMPMLKVMAMSTSTPRQPFLPRTITAVFQTLDMSQ